MKRYKVRYFDGYGWRTVSRHWTLFGASWKLANLRLDTWNPDNFRIDRATRT